MAGLHFVFFAVVALAGAALPASGAPSVGALPDFSGFWSRETFGFEPPFSGPGPVRNVMRRADGTADARRVMGDYNSPVLEPAASDVIRKRGNISLSGKDYPTPSNQCWPMVAPYIFRVQGMEVLQQKDHVTLIYMQDHQFREVRLNARHPAHVTPSWHGDSVGHYEGDTLVVDTIAVKPGPVPMLDMYGTPFSDSLHVTERYRLLSYKEAKQGQQRGLKEFGPPATEQGAIIDPKYRGPGIRIQFTVDDPKMFTRPWSGLATYLQAQGGWVENVCAENVHEYYSAHDTEVPSAERADF
jgi:hypothetical protein